jgi:hypothetical protein
VAGPTLNICSPSQNKSLQWSTVEHFADYLKAGRACKIVVAVVALLDN